MDEFAPVAFPNRAIPFSQANSRPDPSASADVQSQLESFHSQFNSASAPSESYQTSIGLDGSSTATVSTDEALTGSVMSTTAAPSSTSYIKTTFATSTSSAGAAISTAYPGDPVSAGQDPSSPPYQQKHHDGLSNGELAAAIVLPILAAIAIVALAFVCMQRRNKQNRERSGSGGVPFFPAMKQKLGSLRSSNESQNASRNPVVMTEQNNAYFTGLDTSSHNSREEREEYYAPGRRSEGGTTFIEAPPPYKSNSQNRVRISDVPVPQLSEPTGFGVPFNLDMSHLDTPTPPPQAHDPISPLSPAHLTADPPQSSGRSARSITSTLYSDTASVHSARAARRSVGPNIVQPVASRRGSDEDEGPFGDEANTPVTPLSIREQ